MEATVDKVGRIVIPKPLRDALGLQPGSKVDLSIYGLGIQLLPERKSARLVRNEFGRLVATSDYQVTQEDVDAIRDATRR